MRKVTSVCCVTVYVERCQWAAIKEVLGAGERPIIRIGSEFYIGDHRKFIALALKHDDALVIFENSIGVTSFWLNKSVVERAGKNLTLHDVRRIGVTTWALEEPETAGGAKDLVGDKSDSVVAIHYNRAGSFQASPEMAL
ncbi:MAG TPA: hypothetical protein VET25_03805 [Aestuariivirgaceae bacterium]|nr:hypothetical protein [Aestuariivirgaceae bacterium]